MCVTLLDELILDIFSSSFVEEKDLAVKLKNILFVQSIPKLSTPKNPNPMYEEIIMAFNNTIKQIRG
ncbi:BgTH12-03778 [Blumeria graminis f. sp. triticale]|uniref:Bgt-50726 n=2 Tax=Blumeria graminis TaxID=34373 RepID=A0A9X9PR33_BLUGR|nr:BgTH12-03778 [Blumeria graminis f. sp. triticale]VCU39838.1 Bgt-50726 [Blumeria graminis f. sp. tritici]